MRRPHALLGATAAVIAVCAAAAPSSASSSSNLQTVGNKSERYLVVTDSDAQYQQVQSDAKARGAKVHELHGNRTLAIEATPTVAAQVRATAPTATVVRDHIETLIGPESGPTKAPTGLSSRIKVDGNHKRTAPQDPAASYDGLTWDQNRIQSPQANAVTYGSPKVTVAIADTGLDYTHSELKDRVSSVVDFTGTEDPPICKTYFGASDEDLAAAYGGPANTDWNGHGSWIGGNIGGALDNVGINGIAPKVDLVALKISQWCGSAYDSEILGAFEYAASHKIDVVSISFGGYLNRANPDEDAVYRSYVDTVARARAAGTLIVAAAGNEHVRIGAGGLVLSHGQLTTPGTPVDDLYGLYETPGGIPGVVDVSSTGNVVAKSSPSCVTPSGTAVTCKPQSDAHQAAGSGKQDQLAYYSNYGPRIDVAAPGGARKFNLPVWDGGGTPGFPVTTDSFDAYEEFSITSNWATEIPCYTLAAPDFHADECYSTIQGTSMATPHASAVAALIASAHPSVRHDPAAIVALLKHSAEDGRNYTQPLSPTDLTPADLSGAACTAGYCHLGGPAISSREAYGAGIINALRAVR
jgi:subtilisin family serine protease